MLQFHFIQNCKISIHAPAKGATLQLQQTMRRLSSFQSTLPRRERHDIGLPCSLEAVISIHAPAKGATKAGKILLQRFKNFNPRSREGSDKLELDAGVFTGHYFNPRSREGSDPTHWLKEFIDNKISIHAPAKGATLWLSYFCPWG